MNQIRIDYTDDTNLIKSWKGEKIKNLDGSEKNIIVTSFGQEIKDTTLDLKDRLEMLLIRCFSFSQKLCNYDELTGEHFPNGDIICMTLKGTDAISDHHCAGSILFNEKNERYFKFLEIMLWHKYNIITEHNLKNTEIKIMRTSGNIEKGIIDDFSIRWNTTKYSIKSSDNHTIYENNSRTEIAKYFGVNKYDIEECIQYKTMIKPKNNYNKNLNPSEKYKIEPIYDFVIKVYLASRTLEKSIPLKKIIELNPELEIIINLPIVENIPIWLNELCNEWKQFIKNKFKLGKINETPLII